MNPINGLPSRGSQTRGAGSADMAKPVTPQLGQRQTGRAALLVLGNTLSNTTQPLEPKRVTIA